VNLVRYIGPAIRWHREHLRISQEELAARAQLDRTYVSGVERGKRNPTVAVMQRLADALGSDLDVIFSTSRRIAQEAKEK
jgi:transcriptional regulator with XRE-family HTH domain